MAGWLRMKGDGLYPYCRGHPGPDIINANRRKWLPTPGSDLNAAPKLTGAIMPTVRPYRFTVLALLLILPAALGGQTPDKPGPAARPATLEELRQTLDWFRIPKLPGANRGRQQISTLSYQAPGTLAETAKLYRQAITAQGWTEAKQAVPGVDPNQYLTLDFEKGPFRLGVYAGKLEPSGQLDVRIYHNGNVDPRRFPKLPDSKVEREMPVFSS